MTRAFMQAIHRATIDPVFRAQLATDPAAALHSIGIAEDSSLLPSFHAIAGLLSGLPAEPSRSTTQPAGSGLSGPVQAAEGWTGGPSFSWAALPHA